MPSDRQAARGSVAKGALLLTRVPNYSLKAASRGNNLGTLIIIAGGGGRMARFRSAGKWVTIRPALKAYIVFFV